MSTTYETRNRRRNPTRDRMLTVPLTTEELEAVHARAAREMRSASSLARMLLLGGRMSEPTL
jgi:hypothetical protein